MIVDLDGKVALVSGGTRGVGLAIGLAIGRAGAHVHLTHRWGSADEDDIRARFAAAGAPAPTVIEADAARDADTVRLVEAIRGRHDGVDVFVSNVCAVSRVDGALAHRRRDLASSLRYSAWPLVGYLQAMKAAMGRYPRYVVSISSDGPDTHYPGYDHVAVAKAVVETQSRYLAEHLRDEGVRVNVVRARQVATRGYEEAFDAESRALASFFEEFAVSPDEVAGAVLALCSGLLDAMSGQVIQVDRGAAFVDNVMTLGPRLLEAARNGGAR